MQVQTTGWQQTIMVVCNAQHTTCTVSPMKCSDEVEGGMRQTIIMGGILPENSLVRMNQKNEESSLPTHLNQIESLNEIASMETIAYQQRLVENTLPTLQDPNLSKLNWSIHRFHALVSNLTKENDHQTVEILDLQSKNEASREHIEKLEKAVKKLHVQNVKLKLKAKADKSMLGKLMEQVKHFDTARRIRMEEEQVGKLLHHESILRERSDSNFSDIDGLQDFDGQDSIASSISLVMNEPPTIRIHRQRTLTWPRTDFNCLVDNEGSGNRLSSNNTFESSIDSSQDFSLHLPEGVEEDIISRESGCKSVWDFWKFDKSQSKESYDDSSKVDTITIPTEEDTKEDISPLNNVMSIFYKSSKGEKFPEDKSNMEDLTIPFVSCDVDEKPLNTFKLKQKDASINLSMEEESSTSTTTNPFVVDKGFSDSECPSNEYSETGTTIAITVSTDKEEACNATGLGESVRYNKNEKSSNQQTSEKFKTSMKNMGRLFTFHRT
jgi:hypothetical protein